MFRLKILFFLLIPFSVSSQIVSGIIYDHKETIKGAKITNASKKVQAFSNEKGEFSIEASVNDTLIFSSYFHKGQTVQVTKKHIETTTVIVLEKIINTLTEVLVTNEPGVKKFTVLEYTQDLGLQIKNDIKKNPHLYQPAPSGNLDLIKIASLITKLLKSKKPKESPFIPTTYEQLDSLFNTDTFFNNKLLHTNLKIPKKYKGLFFDYCDAKKLDNKLLLEKNNFILLDSLVKFSNDFLKIIDKYNKSK